MSPAGERLQKAAQTNKIVTIDLVRVDKKSNLSSIVERDNADYEMKDALQKQENLDLKDNFSLKDGAVTAHRNTATDINVDTHIQNEKSSHTLMPAYYASASFVDSHSATSKGGH